MNVPTEVLRMVEYLFNVKKGLSVEWSWSFYDRDFAFKSVSVDRDIKKKKIKVGFHVVGESNNWVMVKTEEEVLDKLREIFSNIQEIGGEDDSLPN